MRHKDLALAMSSSVPDLSRVVIARDAYHPWL